MENMNKRKEKLDIEDDIIITIKKEHSENILQKKKNYEFRKYIPKNIIKRIWVYTSAPIGRLEYMMEIDKIIEYPERIKEDGIGNEEFNRGLKKSKYAYHISHLYVIKNTKGLKELREKYDFYPPQKYIYLRNNIKLQKYILNIELEKLY